MTQTARPQALPPAFPSRANDRRERFPVPSTRGYGDVPAFDRTDTAPHPVTQARPQPASGQPLAQVIHMAATGLWVVKRNGRVAEINGNSHWESRNALAVEAERAGVALSDLVIRTGALG